MQVFDERLQLLARERLAEFALNQKPLGLFDDFRLVGFGDAHQRAQRGEIEFLLFRDDLEQKCDRSHVADFSHRLQHRLPHRFLGVERQNRRQRGAVADLAEGLDHVKLEPEVVALQKSDQGRERGGIAVFAQRGHSGRGDVDVLLGSGDLQQEPETGVVSQIAQQIHQRKANVSILLRAKAQHDRADARRSNADESLGRRIALARVLRVCQRIEQAADHPILRVPDESVDDRLANAPVLVAEKLEHQSEVAPC